MAERVPLNKYYVYEHWRPDTNVCFYVGKGLSCKYNNRAFDFRQRNTLHKRITAKLKRLGLEPEVRYVRRFLAEEAAFALEIERIAF